MTSNHAPTPHPPPRPCARQDLSETELREGLAAHEQGITRAPLRNADPSQITRHGFVESPGLLSPVLCGSLARVSMRRAELISNSLSKDVTGKLQREVAAALAYSPTIQEAAFTTFGTRTVSVHNLKVRAALRHRRSDVSLSVSPQSTRASDQ